MQNTAQPYYEEIKLRFSLSNCKKGHTYLIEFSIPEDSINFKTEKIKSKSDNSLIEFSNTLVCRYYFYKPQNIQINVHRWKNTINFRNFPIKKDSFLTLSSIISSNNTTFQSKVIKSLEDSETISIKVEESNNIETNDYCFIDFIKNGITLDPYIGIDFNDKLLHISDLENNQYMNAIRGFRETIINFTREFEVFGYGLNLLNFKIKTENNEPYFNLNLKEDPTIMGLTNIKIAYKECLDKIDFSENNNMLSPLLKYVEKRIYEKKKLKNYSILFLLMSNAPKKEDFKNCIDNFIESSFLPLSILIIGIGDKESEFEKIKELYSGITNPSNGKRKQRDNICFISMKECNYDDNLLKDKCLTSLPRHMIEYYKLVETTPDQIKEHKLTNIEKGILNLNKYIEEDDDTLSAPPLIVMEGKNDILRSKTMDGNKANINNDFDNMYEKPTINNDNNITNNDLSNKKTKLYQNITPGKDGDNVNINQLNPPCNIKKSKTTPINEIKINNNNLKDKKLINTPGYQNNNVYKNTPLSNPFAQEDKKYVNTPNDVEGNLNNNNKKLNNPFAKEDKKYVNTPKDVECDLNNNNKNLNNPFAQENKKYVNTPKDVEGDLNNNNKNLKNPFAQKYINTPKDNIDLKKNMENPYNQNDKKLNNKQSLNEKNKNIFCYDNTPGNVDLKSTINTNINNNNPYNQTPLPQEGKVMLNEKKIINNSQYDEDEKKNTEYFINTPVQDQENKMKNMYQPNPFLKEKDIKNNDSIPFYLLSVNKDNHINSASNIDFEKRQNKNVLKFDGPLQNYSIDD